MDEEVIEQEQINNEVEQPVETTEEQIEETPEEVVEPETPVEEPVAEYTEEERPPSRRESLRIQKLIEKMRESKPAESKPQFNGLDYRTALDADQEVVEKLEQDRINYGNQGYQQGLEQAKAIQFNTRLEIDAPKVLAKHPELDPENKEKFDANLADAINTMYLSTTGYDNATGRVVNPDIRYSDYAESIFELANRIAGQKVDTSVRNVAKQAAATGLRPDGSSSKKLDLNKPVERMTNEELEAYGKQLGLNTIKRY